jgi:DNA-binding FrmR family transcriptional regulator
MPVLSGAATGMDWLGAQLRDGLMTTMSGTAGNGCLVVMFVIAHLSAPRLHKPSGGMSIDSYTPHPYMSSMQKETKTALLKRLNRIEGQVRGLSRMVEENRYCIDVVTQITAVRAALRRAEEEILRDHVAHCVAHAIASGDTKDQGKKIAEIMEVIGRTDR